MKTLGLIGGMSWESTAVYYRLLNEDVRRRLGGQHSSRLLLHSVDFDVVVRNQHADRWDLLEAELVDLAMKLEGVGADALVLCTNTMHQLAPAIQRAVAVPLLHIADPTGEALRDDGHTIVGLIGTKFTMEREFYRDRLQTKYGLEVHVPDDRGRADVHRIIYDELCRGTVKEASRERYREIVDQLRDQGATAVILGCTEIGLLLRAGDASLPLFDTTALHCRAAVDFQLAASAGRAPRRRPALEG